MSTGLIRTRALRFVFFFFQAEDGIRDYKVTGVQTCALPISASGTAGVGRLAPRGSVRTMSSRRAPSSPTASTDHMARDAPADSRRTFLTSEIGRASCRERV